jgi:diacylglycerol kinase (ATP)
LSRLRPAPHRSADPGAAAPEPRTGRTFVILNPAAGRDDPARLCRRIGEAFVARNATFDLEETRHAGHATELARQAAARGYRAICVVGGDGTLAEAIGGLAGTDVPLAIIPRGTANQVARNLGIPTRLEPAIDVAVRGVPIPMDFGHINGRTFALVAGAGYDAAVMAAATRDLKERWGFAAYLYAAIKAALAPARPVFRIVADGHTIETRAITVMIANMGRLFASLPHPSLPLSPHPDRAWNDGLLDLLIVAPRSLPELATLVWRAANRRFTGDPRLLHLQARTISVHADPPAAVQIDGDPAGTTPITASVVPGGVRILVPTRAHLELVRRSN